MPRGQYFSRGLIAIRRPIRRDAARSQNPTLQVPGSRIRRECYCYDPFIFILINVPVIRNSPEMPRIILITECTLAAPARFPRALLRLLWEL